MDITRKNAIIYKSQNMDLLVNLIYMKIEKNIDNQLRV